jgi:quinolinate synthase
MADNVSINHPSVTFVKLCNLCPHMKRITLPKIRRSLETMTHEVTIPSDLAFAARRSVERMLAVV